MSAEVPQRGLIVYRASRLEALLDPLRQLLQAAPPDDLLAPAELLTAHPGMRRWLLNRLAEGAGARGIAANIDIALPGQWIDRLFRERLPDSAATAPPYATGALRWALFALLGQAQTEALPLPRLQAYLGPHSDAPRRWQLASALAELFGRLLVYRPDWLEAWADGRDPIADADELPALWRALRGQIGVPHRSEQHAALLRAAAAATEQNAAPLHVFGLSHLPPRQLDVLRAVSRQRLVVMYCPDPCVEHWAGLGSERQRLRQLLDSPPGADRTLLHLETGHPLLASLGRLGQQFGALLAGADAEIVADVRHSLDATPSPEVRRSLLGRLQESIRQLAPETLALRPDEAALPLGDDASLRVHRCHGRWRELEVLRDALLQALRELPDLQPSQIAVLAPSMADYAPLLGAVFGAAGDPSTPLPYHLADLPIARSHSLHAAWLELIAQAQARSSAPQLMALLRLPAVRRSLELDEDDLDAIQHGLGEAAAALGLDAGARAEEGLPAIAEHTLAWGLDRLCLAYAVGDEEDRPLLFDGLRPAGSPGEGEIHALGGLHRLLAAISRLRREAASPRPASQWIDMFRTLWRSLFRIDPGARDEVDAEDALLDCLGEVQRSLRDAGCDPAMSFAQAQAMLHDQLGRLGDRGHFLHGAISFCGMVPQRALPYRMICILGLGEGEFPRRPAHLQIDPLPRHPRIGDRDVMTDDRYLFLETLMAARERLHLSWVGEDARDGSARLPSPVLGELLDLLDTHLGTTDRPWLLSHPLQPFDLRYARDPDAAQALRSFGPLWRAPTPAPPAESRTPQDPRERVGLEALRGWLRNPAQELLRQRWRMPLRGLDADTLPADEPLDARLDARAALWRALLRDALASGSSPPEQPDPLLRASGQLPPGRPGLLAYAGQRRIACALFEQARALPAFGSDAETLALPIRLDLNGLQIQGSLPLQRQADTFWLVDFAADKTHFGALAGSLDLLLRAALLGLSMPAGSLLQVRRLAPGTEDAWAAARSLSAAAAAAAGPQLEQVVSTLCECWQQALVEPLAYFPRSSQALLDDKDVESAWTGGDFATGERDWQPGYAWLLAGERCFWRAEDPARRAFESTAQRLADLLAKPWPTEASA